MKRTFYNLIFIISFTLKLILSNNLNVQTNNGILRIDPPNWWVGMQNNEISLVIKGTNIASYTSATVIPEGITVADVTRAESNDYIFLDILISDNAQPNMYTFTLVNGNKTMNFKYELKKRNIDPNKLNGINSSDLIYLIMPDRFANGNLKNDALANFNENKIQKDSILGRHGGDLTGIANHLNYISDLGAATLWLNPVQENNQPKESYHGYAITDHYKVDARIGTLDDYKNLVESCHQKNMKIVMDMVFNHPGNEHYLFKKTKLRMVSSF